jgi:hypothetical protein
MTLAVFATVRRWLITFSLCCLIFEGRSSKNLQHEVSPGSAVATNHISDLLNCKQAEIYLYNKEYLGIDFCRATIHRIPDRYTAYKLGDIVKVARMPPNLSFGDPLKTLTTTNEKFTKLGFQGLLIQKWTYPCWS